MGLTRTSYGVRRRRTWDTQSRPKNEQSHLTDRGYRSLQRELTTRQGKKKECSHRKDLPPRKRDKGKNTVGFRNDPRNAHRKHQEPVFYSGHRAHFVKRVTTGGVSGAWRDRAVSYTAGGKGEDTGSGGGSTWRRAGSVSAPPTPRSARPHAGAHAEELIRGAEMDRQKGVTCGLAQRPATGDWLISYGYAT